MYALWTVVIQGRLNNRAILPNFLQIRPNDQNKYLESNTKQSIFHILRVGGQNPGIMNMCLVKNRKPCQAFTQDMHKNRQLFS